MFGSASQTLTFGASGYSQEATQSPEKKARVEDRQNCLAATVRVVSDAVAKQVDESADIQIHGIEVANVVLMGVVENMVEQATTLEFTLNDGSGRIKVRQYQNEGSPKEGIQTGGYVSVVGSLRKMPQLHVSALSLRAVQGADEVSYHMIEVGHTAMKLLRRNDSTTKDASTPAPKVKPEAEMSPPKEAVSEPVPQPRFAAADTEMVSTATTALKGATEVKEAVAATLRKLSETADDAGVALARIVEVVGPRGASENQVRDALAELVNDAEIYTTIDDDHFALL